MNTENKESGLFTKDNLSEIEEAYPAEYYNHEMLAISRIRILQQNVYSSG